MSKRVFITVGEVSGDRHAGNFARELKKLDPTIVIEGHGGARMREAGVVVHRDTVARSAMGLKAAFRALEVRSLLKWTKAYFAQSPPDLQVCIDSWSMNWHFARLGKNAGAKVLYFIAPQAWASRPGRVSRLRRYVDRLACILPFEQEWFGRQGIPTTFVGHPLFDHLKPDRGRAESHFPSQPPVIGVLPGSRRGVAKDNCLPLMQAALLVRGQFPSATFLVPTTTNTHAIALASQARLNEPDRPLFTIRQDAFDEMVPRCDLCLTVSGTATLHVASYGVPMIVVYRGSRVLWHLVGRWIINTRTYSLVNLLDDSHEHIVPEFIPWYGKPDKVAEAAIALLKHPEMLQRQSQRLHALVRSLDQPGASLNVAKLAMELLNPPPAQQAGDPESPAAS